MYSLKESLAVAKNPATNIRYLIDIFIEYHKKRKIHHSSIEDPPSQKPEISNRKMKKHSPVAPDKKRPQPNKWVAAKPKTSDHASAN